MIKSTKMTLAEANVIREKKKSLQLKKEKSHPLYKLFYGKLYSRFAMGSKERVERIKLNFTKRNKKSKIIKFKEDGEVKYAIYSLLPNSIQSKKDNYLK